MGNANDFLMSGGVKSAKFEKVGTVVKGTIIREPELQQQRDPETQKPLFWDEDRKQPRQQVKVVLQTEKKEDAEDDGTRAIYVKGNMLRAVQKAVKDAGASGLAVGGKLAVKYVKDGEKKTKAFNAPKLYEAKYEAPDPVALAAASEQAEAAEDGESLDDF